ncbi:MAG TPA: hypothetical protein VLJ10_02945 [Candidatus Bathyarchaeia archaeon]|nr:hypothetical protein [Candidatus Bathyarchaeia archaeon]
MGNTIFLGFPDAERLDTMVKFFKKNAFEVSSAAKGPEVLQKLSSMNTVPGIVVLSAQLRDTTAVDICKQLKGTPKFNGVTFLIALPEEMAEQPYADIGITEFIDESCDNDRLLRKINVILNYGKTAIAGKSLAAKLTPLLVIGGVVLVFIFFLMKILASFK